MDKNKIDSIISQIDHMLWLRYRSYQCMLELRQMMLMKHYLEEAGMKLEDAAYTIDGNNWPLFSILQRMRVGGSVIVGCRLKDGELFKFPEPIPKVPKLKEPNEQSKGVVASTPDNPDASPSGGLPVAGPLAEPKQ